MSLLILVVGCDIPFYLSLSVKTGQVCADWVDIIGTGLALADDIGLKFIVVFPFYLSHTIANSFYPLFYFKWFEFCEYHNYYDK